MMNREKETAGELIELPYTLSLPQRFSTGPVMGRFLTELRDNRRIMANRCPSCGRAQLPPREVCAICHCEADEWLEVGPEGEIVTYDTVLVPTLNPLTGRMREVPYTTGNILLDGADVMLWHLLNETDPARLKTGLRVRARFREEGRRGSIHDIEHFELIEHRNGEGR